MVVHQFALAVDFAVASDNVKSVGVARRCVIGGGDGDVEVECVVAALFDHGCDDIGELLFGGEGVCFEQKKCCGNEQQDEDVWAAH